MTVIKSKRRMWLGEYLESEILMRLPAKSLMRFKCVQRSWNLLIKSPTFITAWHMHHQNDRRLMTLDEEEHTFNPCITLLSCDDPTPTRTLLKSLFPSSSMTKPLFYGHCNGVFCLYDLPSDQLILWNPATREVHAIPPPLFPYHGNYPDPALPVFGFGADPSSPNDFKVIHLNLDNYWNFDSIAQIYNISTKSWTLIHRHVFPTEDISILNRNPSRYNALVNGVYHWLMSSRNNIQQTILCFDFHNNRFSKIDAPIYFAMYWWKKEWDDVAEINGSLTYVMLYKYNIHQFENKLVIWVKNQRGWVMKYQIWPTGPNFQIRGIWKNGSQFLGGKAGQLLTSYDRCNENLVHEFQVKLPDDKNVFRVYEYVASIAPLST